MNLFASLYQPAGRPMAHDAICSAKPEGWLRGSVALG